MVNSFTKIDEELFEELEELLMMGDVGVSDRGLHLRQAAPTGQGEGHYRSPA